MVKILLSCLPFHNRRNHHPRCSMVKDILEDYTSQADYNPINIQVQHHQILIYDYQTNQ